MFNQFVMKLTKQGYTPRSVPSEQKEETKKHKENTKRARVYSKKLANRVLIDIPKNSRTTKRISKSKRLGILRLHNRPNQKKRNSQPNSAMSI